MGQSGCVAQWKVAEQQSGNAAVLHNVLGSAHDHRANSVGLQMPCGQRHRLVTDRAVCHQDRHVYAIGATTRKYFRTVYRHGVALAAVGGDAVESRSN